MQLNITKYQQHTKYSYHWYESLYGVKYRQIMYTLRDCWGWTRIILYPISYNF